MATKITGTNTAAAPGVTGDDTDTGLFYGTNEIGFSTGGTSRLTLDSSGFLNVPDNGKIRFGTGNDLAIYHDGSTASVIDAKAGDYLYIYSDNLRLNTKTGAEKYITGTLNGAVELYFDNSLKFETQGGGIKISGGDSGGSTIIGDVFFDNGNQAGKDIDWDQSTATWTFYDNTKLQCGTGGDLQIFHDGTDSYVKHDLASGFLKLVGDAIKLESDTSNELYLRADKDAGISLYYDNSKRFETIAGGASVTGELHVSSHIDGNDSTKIKLGTGDDLQIYHNGSSSQVNDTGGDLYIQSNTINFRDWSNGDMMIKATSNAAVDLYHNNSKTFSTDSQGVIIQGIEGEHGVIYLNADEGDDNADQWGIVASKDTSKFTIQNFSSGGWEKNIECDGDGEVKLYANNTLETRIVTDGLKWGAKANSGDNTTNGGDVGGKLSDGWTYIVSDGSTGGNTPWTWYNKNASYDRYMAYVRFDGGIMSHQSNDGDLCDERIKQDFDTVPSQWDNIKNIDLKKFRYKNEPSDAKLKVGVVAQQVETIYPDLVEEDWPIGDANPNTHEVNSGAFYKSVKKDQLLMYSLKALQEAMAKIETLETNNTALTARVTALEAG